MLVVLVAIFAFQFARIPLTAFTLIGGALAIGIGFGTQNLVNNFISGIILLVERPVRVGDLIDVKGSTTIGEGSVGSMISGPMRDPRPPSMITGPVSEISRGPVTSFVPVTSHVAVRDASAGAVTREAERSVGEPLLEPEQDLFALQEQLRSLRQQAEEEEALRATYGDEQQTVDAEETGTTEGEERVDRGDANRPEEK